LTHRSEPHSQSQNLQQAESQEDFHVYFLHLEIAAPIGRSSIEQSYSHS
jgi:hypothetical protein